MTEAEWLICTKPVSMLRLLGSRATGRKLRLLACACYREREWHRGAERAYRGAVEVAELYADGLVDGIELLASQPRPRATVGGEPRYGPGYWTQKPEDESAITFNWKNLAARDLTSESMNPVEAGAVYAAGMHSGRDARRFHAELVRCIFGNPFHTATVDPAWLTSTVVQLAEGIYADRAFDRLPILADALQDAGCDHPDILDHCRGPGPHARGCWVVDLVLGKS